MILTKEIITVTKFKDFYSVEDFIKFQEENRHVEIVEKHTATVVASMLHVAPGSDGYVQEYKDTPAIVTRVYYTEEHRVKMKIDPNETDIWYRLTTSSHDVYKCRPDEKFMRTELGHCIDLDKVIRTEILK